MELNTLAFSLTDKCNAQCSVCCLFCSPENNAVLDSSLVKSYIRQAKEMGTVRLISFTGGEALMCPGELRECVRYAHQMGFEVSLVTNGFWGADYRKGFALMESLLQDGLNRITISADKFHQEYIPIQSVKNAIKICDELGLPVAVAVMDIRSGDSVRKTVEDLRPEIYGKEINPYPLFPAGKAESVPKDEILLLCDPRKAKCPFDNSFVVMFDGTIRVCCSVFADYIPAACLGRMGETTLKEAWNNFVGNDLFYVLFFHSFEWYADLAEKLGKSIESRYCSACHLCHELFTDREFMEKALPYIRKEADRLRIRKFFGNDTKR
ncbi:MAG: radical SAM protein [Blautia sp.]|nr:radical SAM protein [Blautia sp.]MCM1200142.1 radical SAM protein [Bacteroides fragilis]